MLNFLQVWSINLKKMLKAFKAFFLKPFGFKKIAHSLKIIGSRIYFPNVSLLNRILSFTVKIFIATTNEKGLLGCYGTVGVFAK
jgi:hypothetical protein